MHRLIFKNMSPKNLTDAWEDAWSLFGIRVVVSLVAFLLAGCTHPQPPREKVSRETVASRMIVRTTAYTHTEAGGSKNAIGSRLRFGGEVSSAAADWSWLPMGTRFRIVETGGVYVVEDYGSALIGKKTIDLYMPSTSMMRSWGVRMVNVEILEWGSPVMSRMLLQSRGRGTIIKRMLASMDANQTAHEGTR